MIDYRLYWIGDDGHSKRAENVECASDEEARMAAIDRRGSSVAVEVWSGQRFVARIGAPKGWKGSSWTAIGGLKKGGCAGEPGEPCEVCYAA